MKRILCFLISGLLMFSSLAVFAADNAAVLSSKEEYYVGEQAVKLLKDIGVAEIDESGLSQPMSRGEFAKYVCKIGGHTEVMGYQAFDDLFNVENGELIEIENAPFINALAQAGVVSKGGNFRPDDSIRLDEAATMLVRILGYEYIAEMSGGFPSGYLAVASRYNLTKGISLSDTFVTKGAAAQLLENTLGTEVVNINYGSNGNSYSASSGVTLAYRTFGIIHNRGIVDAVELTRLKGENTLQPYHVSVDGKALYFEKDDPGEFLGYEVDVYYTDRNDDKRLVLKHMRKTLRNKVTVIPVQDVSFLDAREIKYYVDENEKSQKINISAALIYNNASTETPITTSDLAGKDGTITVLDNTGDGIGDVVFAEVYSDYVIAAVDVSGKKIYDRYDKTKNMIVNTKVNDPYTIIFDENGEEINLKAIEFDNVVSVYESKTDASQKYIELRVSTKQVEGVINRVKKESGKTFIGIDSQIYEMTSVCNSHCGGAVTPGIRVILRLNAKGLVAGIDFKGTEMQLGFLNAAGIEEGLSKTAKVEIFNAAGEFAVFELKDKFTVDGVVYTNANRTGFLTHLNNSAKAMYSEIVTTDKYTQPIRFKVNKDGQIEYLDTICKDDSGTLAKSEDVNGDNAFYRIGNMTSGELSNGLRYTFDRSGEIEGMFGMRFAIGNRTSYFVCPGPSNSNKELYRIINKGYFSGGPPYRVEGFTSEKDNMIADMLVLKNATFRIKMDESVKLAIVSSVSEVLKDDKVVKCINAFGPTGEMEYVCREGYTFTKAAHLSKYQDSPSSLVQDTTLPNNLKPDDLQQGDIVRILNDESGYVSDIQLYFRIEDGNGKGKDGGKEINLTSADAACDYLEGNPTLDGISASSFALRSGYLVRKSNAGISMLRTATKSKLENYNPDLLEFSTIGSCDYIIYDTQAKNSRAKISMGSFNDLVAYDDAGVDCSRIYVQTYLGKAETIIIIK